VTNTTPQVDEEDLVAVAGERETLEGFLEYHRRVVAGKLRGLSDEDARRRLVPSLTGDARGDASWEVGADKTIADVSAEFESACATSREIAAGFTLDQTVPRDQGRVSLRWIYVHIIREHARHIGHADILREQIDGATGD
jgi:Protein of unknown function (DUF664)